MERKGWREREREREREMALEPLNQRKRERLDVVIGKGALTEDSAILLQSL